MHESYYKHMMHSEVRIAKEIQALKPDWSWTECLHLAYEVRSNHGTEVTVESEMLPNNF